MRGEEICHSERDNLANTQYSCHRENRTDTLPALPPIPKNPSFSTSCEKDRALSAPSQVQLRLQEELAEPSVPAINTCDYFYSGIWAGCWRAPGERLRRALREEHHPDCTGCSLPAFHPHRAPGTLGEP